MSNFKIEEIFVFVATDPETGDEGVISMQTHLGAVPLLGADPARADSLRPIAQSLATQQGLEVRLLRFSSGRVVEVLKP